MEELENGINVVRELCWVLPTAPRSVGTKLHHFRFVYMSPKHIFLCGKEGKTFPAQKASLTDPPLDDKKGNFLGFLLFRPAERDAAVDFPFLLTGATLSFFLLCPFSPLLFLQLSCGKKRGGGGGLGCCSSLFLFLRISFATSLALAKNFPHIRNQPVSLPTFVFPKGQLDA